MEHLNRIELRGLIGNIRIILVGDMKVARFSLATSASFRSKDGGIVIETTWHSVSAWEGPQCQNLDSLAKGDFIHIIGRIRTSRITTSDGSERIIYEVVASMIERLS